MQAIERLEKSLHRLEERLSQNYWDVDRLLKVLNRPLEPEQKLGALRSFTSSKNYAEVVQELNKGDAVKLVDTG